MHRSILILACVTFSLFSSGILASDPEVTTRSAPETHVYVRTVPSGAQIRVNGEVKGNSDQLIRLPDGVAKVVVEVDLQGFDSQQRQITVRGGRITRLEFQLREAAPERPDAVSSRPQDGPTSKEPPTRRYVRLVVGQDTMTFEGNPTTWDELPSRLEKIDDQPHTVLEIARGTDELTVKQWNDAVGRSIALVRRHGLKHLSQIGRHPLGSRGSPAPAPPPPETRPDVPSEPWRPAEPKTGRLDLRIAPTRGESKVWFREKEILAYRARLDVEGPNVRREPDEEFGWYPYRGEKPSSSLIVEQHGGQLFVLLSNRPSEVMLANDENRPGFRPKAVSVILDAQSHPAVAVELDEVAAHRLGELTAKHVGSPLAVLLDDQVVSAPTIQSRISNRFLITGSFTEDEARQLARTLGNGRATSQEPWRDVSMSLIRQRHQQMKEILTALALFRADHRGQWPESLDVLIRDQYVKDRKPISITAEFLYRPPSMADPEDRSPKAVLFEKTPLSRNGQSVGFDNALVEFIVDRGRLKRLHAPNGERD